MNNTTWDLPLFDILNFDGGPLLDGVMSAISGYVVWLPLYALIIYMVWRRWSWRGLAIFLVSIGVAVGLADIVAGIFKHTGLLGDLWPSFPVRQRPMFSEGLEGVHAPSLDHGEFGTVSAHAATIVSLTVVAIRAIGRRWFSVVMVLSAVLICYSRIYLACHFPQDILLGTATGLLTGWAGASLFGWWAARRRRKKDSSR